LEHYITDDRTHSHIHSSGGPVDNPLPLTSRKQQTSLPNSLAGHFHIGAGFLEYLGLNYIRDVCLGIRPVKRCDSRKCSGYNTLRPELYCHLYGSLDLCLQVLGYFIQFSCCIRTKRTFTKIQQFREFFVLWHFGAQHRITNLGGCGPGTGVESLRLVVLIHHLHLGRFVHFSL